MMGAPNLVSRAAMRAGAGYVLLGVPGASLESACRQARPSGWGFPPRDGTPGCWMRPPGAAAIVAGPGLGRGGGVRPALVAILEGAAVPVVVDADGLNALAPAEVLAGAVAHGGSGRSSSRRMTVSTPGCSGPPRARTGWRTSAAAAALTGAVVLLKGSTTVVAGPDGRCLLAAAGSSRLATAGTGDVLSGVIGAFLARGIPAFEAAGLAAHAHGRAAALGHSEGLVAGDLPELVARWLSELRP